MTPEATIKDTPHFLTGAPRSGTKVLRDTLGQHELIETSDRPFEDIWEYGHDDLGHQAYSAELVSNDIRQHVREQFQDKLKSDRLFLEKNVVHALRIPYVLEIFPEAKLIHIIRDGRDAVTSAMERWQDPTDWRYYLFSGKGFDLSLKDILSYGFFHLYQIVEKWCSSRSHIDTWGPRFPGIDDYVEQDDLLKTCAKQWKECVRRARKAGSAISSDQYLEVRYEELMTDPESPLNDLADFFQLDDVDAWMRYADDTYRTTSIGRWENSIDNEEAERLKELLQPQLLELDYGHL